MLSIDNDGKYPLGYRVLENDTPIAVFRWAGDRNLFKEKTGASDPARIAYTFATETGRALPFKISKGATLIAEFKSEADRAWFAENRPKRSEVN